MLLLILIAIELSLDGSGHYTSTGKTNKKYTQNKTLQKTQYKQNKTQ
jgi:hypothetical protein